jgi:hypothetical protein
MRRKVQRRLDRESDKRIAQAVKQSCKQGLEQARLQGREVCQCAPDVRIYRTRAEVPDAVPATTCATCGKEKVVVKLHP